MELSCSMPAKRSGEEAEEIFPQTAEEVVRAYADTVYALAFSQLRSRTDADDVFQEVFWLMCGKSLCLKARSTRRPGSFASR